MKITLRQYLNDDFGLLSISVLSIIFLRLYFAELQFVIIRTDVSLKLGKITTKTVRQIVNVQFPIRLWQLTGPA